MDEKIAAAYSERLKEWRCKSECTACKKRFGVERMEVNLMDNRREWARSRDQLVLAIKNLGFPEELGEQIAKQLGSPKAMERMRGYLYNVKPKSAELIVDEMLAICSEINAWRGKKAGEEANARYNEMHYYGLGAEENS